MNKYQRKIREYKEKTGKNDEEVAKLLNVKKSTFSKILSGKCEPNLTSKILLNLALDKAGLDLIPNFLNPETMKSFILANQKNYLDLLFSVYPIANNFRREVDDVSWASVKSAFGDKDNKKLIENLLSLELFPIKDSYASYLRQDHTAIDRNPETINRISGQLYEMGLDKMFENCSEPKDPSKQIGPLFKRWIEKKTLGVPIFDDVNSFINHKGNAVLNVSDAQMLSFAKEYLGYKKDKGLDFVARFNNIYVLGEAKFLTDFGGSQNQQFKDACTTATAKCSGGSLGNVRVETIAILDGVIYVPGNNIFTKFLNSHPKTVVVSSILLRDYLFALV